MSNIAFFLPQDKPTIFSLSTNISLQTLQEDLGCSLMDTYEAWQKELFEIENPQATDKERTTFLASRNSPYHGKWAYYPWRNTAIHIPEVDEFRKIIFSRNFPLIEKSTQDKLWELKIGSAGLSVGSNIAVELVKTGVHKFHLADYDTLAPSNNNRITGGSVFQIGEDKTLLLAKKLYELNPYCEIELFPQGLTQDNFEQFVRDCDILIDEIDSFFLKNSLRDYIHSEKGKGTILLQGADLGESPIVEIESWNDPKFGGRVPELDIHKILHTNPSKMESTRMLVSVVGKENIPGSFLQNFINIKQRKQTYWAQLGIAATAVGAKIAGMVIEIARGNAHKLKLLSRLSLREIENPNEQEILRQFDKLFGYVSPSKRTLFISDEVGLSITRTYGERNILNLTIGGLTINLQEIPGNLLTDEEIDIIHKARYRYKMWGDDLSFLINDPSDRIWEEGLWETTHIISHVAGPNNFNKTFALRKSAFTFDHLLMLATQKKLPLEFAPWRIKHTKTGKQQDLLQAFHSWMNRNQYTGNISTLTRFCTIPQRKNVSELEKETAAITFATMQLFFTDTLHTDIVCNIITQPSIRKVFSIKQGNRCITPAFHKPEATLGFDTSWKTILDKHNPIYTYYAEKVPKYFAQETMVYLTKTAEWRKGAINLLKAAKEKYT